MPSTTTAVGGGGRAPPIHQLSNGLIVSGGPPRDPPRERPPSLLPSRPVPYTGGDIRSSGEIGKMLHVSTAAVDPTSPAAAAAGATSAPSSRPNSRSYSGPLSLIPPTGLITGGSASSSEVERPRPAKIKKDYGTAVTDVSERGLGLIKMAVPRFAIWAAVAAVGLGVGVGVLVMVVVGKFVILEAVAAAVAAAVGVGVWNWGRGRKEVERFLSKFPDTGIDPRNLPVGRIVKVTGVMIHS